MFARLKRIAPRRGWRAFIGEVGIIVLGVLIAVGIGKVVEALDWRDRAAAARIAIDADIREDNFFDLTERLLVTPCLNRQLDRLYAIALDPNGRAPLANVPGERLDRLVYVFPSRSWTTDIWDSAVADGIPSHMSATERAIYGRHYLWMRKVGVMNDASDTDTSDLTLLSEPLPLNLDTRLHLLRVIARERTRVASIFRIAEQRKQELEALGRRFRVPTEQLNVTFTVRWCRAHKLL